MPLDWEHETRRYLYVTEEGSFAALPALTRAFAGFLLKFFDSTGVLIVGRENALDVVCRVVGAHMGERRQIRRIIPALLVDEYLIEQPGALVIRNYIDAQHRLDSERRAALVKQRAATLARARRAFESSTSQTRTVHESSASDARVVHDSGSSGARVVHESSTKPEATPRNGSSPSGLPSGPSVPTQNAAAEARARESERDEPGWWGDWVERIREAIRERGAGRFDGAVAGEKERGLMRLAKTVGVERVGDAVSAICDCVSRDAGYEFLRARYRAPLALSAMLGQPGAEGDFTGDGLFAAGRYASEWLESQAEVAPPDDPPNDRHGNATPPKTRAGAPPSLESVRSARAKLGGGHG